MTANASTVIKNSPTLKQFQINNEYHKMLIKFLSMTQEPNYFTPIKHLIVKYIFTKGFLP